jgi:hypothetical protein
MKRLVWMKSFAKRMTISLREIAESLEKRVEEMIAVFPDASPVYLASLVCDAIVGFWMTKETISI